ncbi:hypothetical protein NEMIN01_1754 [Nematocida minor]|uniref:uncharacterized protein n=1 Tax=Nematocida minor TaxID=1912983 RepID=UPI002220CD30|nr:uncharacterized protein NEMIN01_1754 [Nematocida minor]KAI5191970.1 hypothetical protein NEMIN01_1754 [Nematocida minor]
MAQEVITDNLETAQTEENIAASSNKAFEIIKSAVLALGEGERQTKLLIVIGASGFVLLAIIAIVVIMHKPKKNNEEVEYIKKIKGLEDRIKEYIKRKGYSESTHFPYVEYENKELQNLEDRKKNIPIQIDEEEKRFEETKQSLEAKLNKLREQKAQQESSDDKKTDFSIKNLLEELENNKENSKETLNELDNKLKLTCSSIETKIKNLDDENERFAKQREQLENNIAKCKKDIEETKLQQNKEKEPEK